MSVSEEFSGADFGSQSSQTVLAAATYDDVADAPDLTDPFDTAALYEPQTKCECLTGPAGSGKSFAVRERFKHERGLLTSTTGVSAINLGAVTLNSALGYFNSESLQDKYVSGALARVIYRYAFEDKYKWLCIDEYSMMPHWDLDTIHLAFQDANARLPSDKQIGLLCVGDVGQLPPIPPKGTKVVPWIFRAQCWEKFAANTTRLTKIWRQTDNDFLTALNAARRGDGKTCAEILRTRAKFAQVVDSNFEGTTILPKNDLIDNFNKLRYLKLTGAEKVFYARSWGKLGSETKNIDAALRLKVGAYVVVLANDASGAFEFANGDVGHVKEFTAGGGCVVELVRNKACVTVAAITRTNTSKEEPREGYAKDQFSRRGEQAYWDKSRKAFVLGAITYMPLRLNYASTVHRSQGCTFAGPVQIGLSNAFFGMPAMGYVALSRATKMDNLRIVGTPELLQARIRVDKEVLPWI